KSIILVTTALFVEHILYLPSTLNLRVTNVTSSSKFPPLSKHLESIESLTPTRGLIPSAGQNRRTAYARFEKKQFSRKKDCKPCSQNTLRILIGPPTLIILSSPREE